MVKNNDKNNMNQIVEEIVTNKPGIIFRGIRLFLITLQYLKGL